LDTRRKRLVFRAWHRGMREVDLILGSYATQKIATMHEDELDEFEKILSYEDCDLLSWLNGQVAIPSECDSLLMRDIIDSSVKL